MKRRKCTEEELSVGLKALPQWRLENGQLERWYEFSSFEEAVGFVGVVAELAQKMDHHPDVDIRHRKVRLGLWTHSAAGVTELDFEFARRLDGQRSENL